MHPDVAGFRACLYATSIWSLRRRLYQKSRFQLPPAARIDLRKSCYTLLGKDHLLDSCWTCSTECVKTAIVDAFERDFCSQYNISLSHKCSVMDITLSWRHCRHSNMLTRPPLTRISAARCLDGLLVPAVLQYTVGSLSSGLRVILDGYMLVSYPMRVYSGQRVCATSHAALAALTLMHHADAHVRRVDNVPVSLL